MKTTPMVADRQPVQAVIAFIDILGFRDLVCRAFSSDAATRLTITDAVQVIWKKTQLTTETFRATAFSDSIVLSDRNSQEGISKVLEVAASLSAALLWRGVLCRGGVASGLLIHDNEVLLGPGMLSAYDLERKAAVYPRIIVADELCKKRETPHWRLKQDQDGCWFLDVFHRISITVWEGHDQVKNMPRIGETIQSKLREAKGKGAVGILAKHCWLATWFNAFVVDKKLSVKLIEL